MTRQGGKSVFSSSAAPKPSKHAARAHSKAPARVQATAPVRGATGDLWSGVSSAGTPSMASAASVGGQGGGLGSGVIAGLVILGLGLTGLTGGFVVTAGRRRRAGVSKR